MLRISQATLDGLTATRDINGRDIAVGTKVRSFDSTLWSEDDGQVLGMETAGPRVSYVEGVVEAIGDDVVEGTGRYRIVVESEVYFANGERLDACYGPGHRVYPPLNGTPALRAPCCFGVVALD